MSKLDLIMRYGRRAESVSKQDYESFLTVKKQKNLIHAGYQNKVMQKKRVAVQNVQIDLVSNTIKETYSSLQRYEHKCFSSDRMNESNVGKG